MASGAMLEDTTLSHNMLTDTFVVPPFSVLDTRQGYWQQRRRAWLALGIMSELGRGEVVERADGTLTDYRAPGGNAMPNMRGDRTADGRLIKGNGHGDPLGDRPRVNLLFSANSQDRLNEIGGMEFSAASIFDPVLCELIYRWFSPPGAAVLDPFAGGSVRGIVAARLGRSYTGIDLSARQLASNREQAERIGVAPVWINGDSTQLHDLLDGSRYDLVFTCPPYYDLERYSDDPRDLSAQGSYAEFLDLHALVIARAAEHLRDGRFMVYVVSEVRGKDGRYLGLVPDTIRAAQQAGLHLYNEAVLVNPAGTLPMRVTKQFNAGRKLGRMHQNVLVFAKGAPEPRGWEMPLDDAPAEPVAAGLWDELVETDEWDQF